MPLTPVVLHILLALAGGARHGYAVAQEVESLTEGAIRLGPGTLYGSLRRMLDGGLIEEVPVPTAGDVAGPADERRRYYRLREPGQRALALELERLERVVAEGRAKGLLGSPEPA